VEIKSGFYPLFYFLKILKKFEKMLDKHIFVCYNEYTKFGRDTIMTEAQRKSNTLWRGVPMRFWYEICEHYDEDKLLNADGDIIFVDKQIGLSLFIGRRVLWDFSLSKELYEVRKEEFLDDEGYHDYDLYEVRLHQL
jgi:hypothetical protein